MSKIRKINKKIHLQEIYLLLLQTVKGKKFHKKFQPKGEKG